MCLLKPQVSASWVFHVYLCRPRSPSTSVSDEGGGGEGGGKLEDSTVVEESKERR